MAKNIINLKLIAVLLFVALLAGCSKKDEIKALRQQLEDTQKDLEYWKGAYEAVSADMRNLKATRRNLNTQLFDSAKSAEEQISILQQIVIEQLQIISDQEAQLNEFMNMVGVTTDGQTTEGLPANTQTSTEQTSTEE